MYFVLADNAKGVLDILKHVKQDPNCHYSRNFTVYITKKKQNPNPTLGRLSQSCRVLASTSPCADAPLAPLAPLAPHARVTRHTDLIHHVIIFINHLPKRHVTT